MQYYEKTALTTSRRVLSWLIASSIGALLFFSISHSHLGFIFPLSLASAVFAVGLFVIDGWQHIVRTSSPRLIHMQPEKQINILKFGRVGLQILSYTGVIASFVANPKWFFVSIFGAAICFLGAIAVSYRLYKLEGTWSGGLWRTRQAFTAPLFGRKRCPVCWAVSLILIGGLATSAAVIIYLTVRS